MGLGGGAAGPITTDHRWRALGFVIGPAAFISGWAIGGARMPAGYSSVSDAISRIAAVESPERALMTGAFITYGVAVMAGSTALRTSPLRRAWPLALVNGAATIAVAATPLEHSTTVDTLHGIAATVGYASITALPIVAAGPLRELGHDRAATASIAAGVASGLCLVATAFSESKGFYQRLGLTIGDAWLITTGLAMFRSSRRPQR